MKNLKFALVVIIILAAIPALFYAQIKHESSTPQNKKEKAFEGKTNDQLNEGKNYITVLTVSIAH